MTNNSQKEEIRKIPEIIHYITLRRVVGILAILFPIILILGSITIGGLNRVERSLSIYYYTNMRNIFVGFLCAFALFLFAYKGYEKKDDFAGNLACVFALGVALFPPPFFNFPDLINCNCMQIDYDLLAYFHLVSAGLFLLTLSYFSIFLFTKGIPTPTVQKLRRNKGIRSKKQGKFLNQDSKLTKAQNISANLIILAR